jgi:hypothetical protein
LEAIVADTAATADLIARTGMAIPVVTLEGGDMPGIDPGCEELGRTAVQLLDSLMQERARNLRVNFREVAVEGTWSEGSVNPRPS